MDALNIYVHQIFRKGFFVESVLFQHLTFIWQRILASSIKDEIDFMKDFFYSPFPYYSGGNSSEFFGDWFVCQDFGFCQDFISMENEDEFQVQVDCT